MKTSFEISRDVPLTHMRAYMAQFGLTDDDFDFYGKFTGKIRLDWLERQADRPDGKLILVTAMTPTSRGVWDRWRADTSFTCSSSTSTPASRSTSKRAMSHWTGTRAHA
ncbi:MAG: formate--tetrahydrofolate ligase [Candidatus Latescibacteria bacterium]|nr:formate--tetrahydrofolate ligase [Candidatus Latescibacterota bacterium]